MKKKRIVILVSIALFGAISVILYLIGSLIPIKIAFLNVQFSSLPIILATYLFGPLAGIGVTILRFIFKLIIIGTNTALIGEVTDIVIALGTILGIYLCKSIFKGDNAIIKALFTILFWLIFSFISNYYISAPLYIKFMFDGNVSGFVELLHGYINSINESNYMLYYLLYICLPFNLILSTFNTFLSLIIDRRIKAYQELNSKENKHFDQ